MSKRQKQLEAEHEAFKNRLVDDILGQDTGEKVPMEKVALMIWAFRDDPSVVTFMARFVAKHAGSRHVFDGIEFYLPQLAHMIIHLEVEWDDAILERFALVIAQQSIHVALQLNWFLQGVLEDYQPEFDDGTPNPNYDPIFYSRALKFLKNIERCVVYGKPRAPELQKLYEAGKITKKELILLEQADRRFNALQISADDEIKHFTALDGWLYVQLPQNAASKKTSKEFVHRFCSLEKHVLNCYRSRGGCTGSLKLDRAMSLERANVTEGPNLTINVKTDKYEFRLRCSTKEEQTLWIRRLREEAETSALFSSAAKEVQLKQDLTQAQLERYNFFSNERHFVNSLTEIAEDLRDKDRAERKKLAPEKMSQLGISETVYLPLCNSSDIWRRVHQPLAQETRVFNTKERCPVIMNFLSKRGEKYKGMQIDPNLDVAEFMHSYFEVTPEAMEQVVEGDEEGESEVKLVEEEQSAELEEIDIQASIHSTRSESNVWLQDSDQAEGQAEEISVDEKPKRGNKNFQRLLRESVVVVPRAVDKRLNPVRIVKERRKNRTSVLDQVTELAPMVPILEGSRSKENLDESDNASTGGASLVSVQQSSVMLKDTILFGDLEEGDIDLESIDRAKEFISGGESWAERSARMLEAARKEHALGDEEDNGVQLEIGLCLAKSNDDLRQEVFVMQMIHYYKSVFAKAKLPLWLKTYRILSTSSSTGLLEVLTDATSLDALKKSEGYPGSLRKYFEAVYGGPDSKAFKAAQTNFMQSLAAYSLVSYLLGLKDRHNGNIMIDTRGHLIFIDFGFALGMAPGHEFSFERAPFKLTREYVDLMGGVGSDCYKEFERLFVAGFMEARKNSQIALGLVEIMMYKSNYPCFSGWRYGGGNALRHLQSRLFLHVPDQKVERRAKKLIRQSNRHFGTYLYDRFQLATNGYAM